MSSERTKILLQEMGPSIFHPLPAWTPQALFFYNSLPIELRSGQLKEFLTTVDSCYHRSSVYDENFKRIKEMHYDISEEHDDRKETLRVHNEPVECINNRIVKSIKNKLELKGESRLKIQFQSFGSPGRKRQTFGKHGNILIPNGLIGLHTIYSQPWKFEIFHELEDEIDGRDAVRITWKITNLISLESNSITESEIEAQIRQNRGRSICTRVFRMAMQKRSFGLSQQLCKESCELKKANLRSLIKKLTPKQFSEGSLVFGLQHQIVQDKLKL